MRADHVQQIEPVQHEQDRREADVDVRLLDGRAVGRERLLVEAGQRQADDGDEHHRAVEPDGLHIELDRVVAHPAQQEAGRAPAAG